ncbi:hypothetical protein MMUR_11440 [Mycolicibacterium murale]|jgi:hypothetical protein|uniref:Peptidase C39 n=1 Tax=Mycolicibacterium murale TaxID=182220 RepID=A0A7I9WI48_9MYCO|nr:hypothetical protein [Mycolicibacterium murale]MCV7180785.1 hypothetical protein [Mycolicibacterium murale]GFG57008.1 hypothetical protein MMUR_11440 [Mycolicibacterium murale]
MALDFTKLKLRQRDGVTCGPSTAIVAAAMLDEGYAARLEQAGWFEAEQQSLHRQLNAVWPRALGTTPLGMVTALNRHSGAVRYRWTSRFDAVPAAVAQGWPVPMLLGKVIPRHWVLLIGAEGGRYRIYDPGHGDVLLAGAGELRGGLGFPQVFGYVVPQL